MNTKHLFSLSLLVVTIVTFNIRAESVFDEPTVSVRVKGKAAPAPIDLWVEGKITTLDANSGAFTVAGKRMTFIHAYDVVETAPASYETCDTCTGDCVVNWTDPEAPKAAHCGCSELIVRNAGEPQSAPESYGEPLEYRQSSPTTADELVILEEKDFKGRTNLHPNNQLAPIGYIDDPLNCPCEQTILSPRGTPAFLGSERASNEKSDETAQNVSYEENGQSYSMSALPSRSLKNFKVGDRVMVGFGVNDTGNTAYTIIRQAH